MTVVELIEILREADPLARVAFMAGGFDADHAEEIVAVATPSQIWVRRGLPDKGRESGTPHAIRQDYGDDASGHERAESESEPASVVILSTDEDFLFKAIVKKLMLG